MKRNYKKFNLLTKEEKIFRVINLILMISFSVASLAVSLVCASRGDLGRKFMSSLFMAVAFLFPLLIELIFGRRISATITLFFTLYVVLAGFVGSLLDVYYTFEGFDKIVHFLMGYICTLPGIFILSACQDYKSFKPITILVVCLITSLAIEFVWELVEWGIDRLLGQTMQGAVVEGYNAPLLTDTITDMFCNLSGAILFCIHFAIGKFTKHSLGINIYERELTVNRNDALPVKSEDLPEELNDNSDFTEKTNEK